MQLLYIWMESDRRRSIINTGYNLGGPFLFSIASKEGGVISLGCKTNDNYINSFYRIESESKALMNLTGIIGKNGSGKTRLVDSIIEIIMYPNRIKDKFILIFYENDELILYHNLMNKLEYSEILKEIKTREIHETRMNSRRIFHSNLSIIHFSNIFDGSNKSWINESPKELEKRGLFDISTNYLFRYPDYSGVTKKHSVDKLKIADLHRQVKFISDIKKINKYFDFNLPSRIRLTPTKLDLNWACENINNSIRSRIMPVVLKVDSAFEDHLNKIESSLRNSIINSGQILFLRTIFYVFIHEVNELFLVKANNNDVSLFINFLEGDLLLDDTLVDPLITVPNWLQHASHFFHHEFENGEKNYKELIKFTVKLIEIWDFLIHSESLMRNNQLSLPTLKFFEFWKSYSFFYSHLPFIDISWRNVSSGENALLNLYSRFYSIRRNVLNKNLIVIIDEGDLYLHPQWQKRFVKTMIEFLNDCFPESNIQLLLTSHSPMLLSDIPSNNVIMLGHSQEKDETFAANIHQLFSHNFFIQDGLMGDFAKEKINEIIHGLLSEQKDHTLYEVAKKLTNQIGEPVIKFKITQLIKAYEEKFNLVNLEDRIEQARKYYYELLQYKQQEENLNDRD